MKPNMLYPFRDPRHYDDVHGKGFRYVLFAMDGYVADAWNGESYEPKKLERGTA